jgi:hypothetical protein
VRTGRTFSSTTRTFRVRAISRSSKGRPWSSA